MQQPRSAQAPLRGRDLESHASGRRRRCAVLQAWLAQAPGGGASPAAACSGRAPFSSAPFRRAPTSVLAVLNLPAPRSLQ